MAGLSVGYRPRVVHQGGARAILSAELIEISLVTVPMQPLARVMQISTKGIDMDVIERPVLDGARKASGAFDGAAAPPSS